MIQIKRWDNGEVIFEGDYTSIKHCLEEGVKQGVSFYRAKLNGAKLNDAKLNGAKLNYAELNGAELNYAELNGAKLNDAKLNYAKLNGAELNGAELNYAELNYAEFNRATLPESTVSIPAGEKYYLFISKNLVQAGCQSHHPDKWREFSKEAIANMDGKTALKFYPRLIDLMDFFLGEGDRPEWTKNGIN